jgi:hypothetical protein
LVDTKVDYIYRLGIGYDSSHYTAIGNIRRWSEGLISPDGDMVRPIEVINTVPPVTVGHRHRYYTMEVELDSDNVEAFTDQQVENGDASSRAMRDGALNDPIGYFVAQFKSTASANISHTFTSGKVYLVGAKGFCSNEHGTGANSTIYNFLCYGSRTVGTTNLTEAISTDRKLTGITKVTCNGVDSTNILGVEWEYVTDLQPQFMPNLTAAIGVKEWSGKYWIIRVTTDTKTSIFDSYISDSGAASALPTFIVTYSAVKADGTQQTETHTYEANKVYVSRVEPSMEARWQGERNPVTYEFICIGTRQVNDA